ncbi:MAG: amidohydrolase family protein [Planctomycetota bacterium]|jgi:predicted TIM-barrel fold metal-dependent hydrolase
MSKHLIRIGLGVTMCMGVCAAAADSQLDYLKSIKKFDAHFHARGDASYLREILDDLNMKVVTICTRGTNIERMNLQINAAKEITDKYPRYYAWVTTFDLTARNEPGWIADVKQHLRDSFEHGALGVKVWKEIGMEIKNPAGEYIQIDDPMFDPIYEYMIQQNKPLVAHIGEPIQAWMPLPLGPDGKPTSYWAGNPQWHFYNKPDKPSYVEIMAARDRLLAKHPQLKVIGCHLGSLEFDVDEMAKRFDRYPNFAVGIDGRTRYFMAQARDKVRKFFIKYQDRILYGTDRSGGSFTRSVRKATAREIESSRRSILDRHRQFFRYYATDDEIPWDYYTVRGLALPKEVLQQVFYDNVVRWLPGAEKAFQK